MRLNGLIFLSVFCIACTQTTPPASLLHSATQEKDYWQSDSNIWLSERDQQFIKLAQNTNHFPAPPEIETTTVKN